MCVVLSLFRAVPTLHNLDNLQRDGRPSMSADITVESSRLKSGIISTVSLGKGRGEGGGGGGGGRGGREGREGREGGRSECVCGCGWLVVVGCVWGRGV